jgi:hypothetical protein
MDDKGFTGIYVGYNYDDLTYRIYDIEKKIVINSRDVQFFDDVIVKPESDEQLVVTEEVEEDQFELEEITHHNNDEEEEDELLYHYSPTTTPTIPMDIINNNNNNNNNNNIIINEGKVTGVKISPIVMNKPLVTRYGATNTRSTQTLSAIEGVRIENPPPVCNLPSNTIYDDTVTYDTHYSMSPTDVKEKLNIIADYVTNAAASDTSTVKVIYSMLNEISPKGEHLGFEGELFNTPHPVCKNLTTTIDEGGGYDDDFTNSN